LDGVDRLLARQHAADREEAGLHDRVDSRPHACLARHPVTVDDEEAQALGEDLLLRRAWEVAPDLARSMRAVEQEDGAWLGGAEHVEPIQKGELVAGDEGAPGDEVRGAALPRARPAGA